MGKPSARCHSWRRLGRSRRPRHPGDGSVVRPVPSMPRSRPRCRRCSPEPPIESAGMSDEVTVLFPREEIRERVEQLGAVLPRDYAGRTPVLISVLKGGSIFLADLFRAMPVSLRVEFMSISAYGGA